MACPAIRSFSLGVFLIGGSQNETRPPRISPFRRSKRAAPDIGPRIVACPDAPGPPRRPTQILTNRWACACIRRPSTNPHPQNPLDGITSSLHPPRKNSLIPAERFGSSPRPRISCPLRNCPSPAPRSKRTTQPVALPVLLPPVCYFLRSQRPRGSPMVLFMTRGRRRDIQAKMGC